MFYIYHIPGVKIGCTQNYPQRCIDQGFDNYELLETHNDIEVASDRELELQEQYGYSIDRHRYVEMTVRGRRGAISQLRSGTHNFIGQTYSKGCTSLEHQYAFASAGGKANKGKPKEYAKQLAKDLNTEWTCEVCGKSGRGRGNYVRYHKNKH